MQRIQARLSDHGKDVVFLNEELPGGIEPDTMICQTRANFIGLLNDKTHCLVPCCALELPVFPDERVLQSVWVADSNPSGQC